MTTGSAFTPILREVVERVPGAWGAYFADADGEAVDLWARDPAARFQLSVVGAHYGVVLHRVQKMLNLFHFGEAHEALISHDRLDLVVRAIAAGYYVVLVAEARLHLSTAMKATEEAARRLRVEMAL